MTRYVAVIAMFLTVIFISHFEVAFADLGAANWDKLSADLHDKEAQLSQKDTSSVRDSEQLVERREQAEEESEYEYRGVQGRGRRIDDGSLVRQAQRPFGMESPLHIVREHFGVRDEFWCAVVVLLFVFGLPTLCIITLFAIMAWFIVRKRDIKAAELLKSQQNTERRRSMLYSNIGCIRRPASPVFEVQPADEEFIRIANKHRLSITKY